MTTTIPSPHQGVQPQSSNSAERLAYIALALVPGLGARRVAALLSRFGAAQDILRAPPAALCAVEGIGVAGATAIRAAPMREAELLAHRAVDRGLRVVVPCDPGFPAHLRTIPDPPVMLFLRGDRPDALELPAVAIVGSRDHSSYGGRMARALGEVAAQAGACVVSGMARGLDAVAQTAALDAGGVSIGVLGTGADVIYPWSNRALFDRMESAGLLLTEHAPGERPTRGSFPRRNRLISGLAKVLVVIEAGEASGTLVTVACALEQGREVLAVPGPIDSATSWGTNQLLRDGATPLLAPDDLLQALGLPPVRTQSAPGLPCTLSPEEAQALTALSGDPRQLDEVAISTGLPIGILLGALLGLELGGLIEQLPGQCYRRK